MYNFYHAPSTSGTATISLVSSKALYSEGSVAAAIVEQIESGAASFTVPAALQTNIEASRAAVAGIYDDTTRQLGLDGEVASLSDPDVFNAAPGLRVGVHGFATVSFATLLAVLAAVRL